MLTMRAPAKINLTLEVLGKRPDGFHEIRSVMQTVNLCDILHFTSGTEIRFSSDSPGWSSDESLVVKAARLVQEITGFTGGMDVAVEKHILLMSGLGGDSSNAAAVLRGLNQLWRLDLPPEKLLGIAGQLGSDVSFFLYGGTALAEGRGEKITPLPSLQRMWAVLVVPDVPALPGKTGRLYASLKPAHYTDGRITQKVVDTLNSGKEFEPSLLFNTFENVAFDDFNLQRVYVEHLLKLGAPHVHLAGSGPTLFTLLQDKAQAEDLYRRCRQQNMAVYLAETVNSLD